MTQIAAPAPGRSAQNLRRIWQRSAAVTVAVCLYSRWREQRTAVPAAKVLSLMAGFGTVSMTAILQKFTIMDRRWQ